MNYEEQNARYVKRVEDGLRAMLPQTESEFETGRIPKGLAESMRYSLLAGRRFRGGACACLCVGDDPYVLAHPRRFAGDG